MANDKDIVNSVIEETLQSFSVKSEANKKIAEILRKKIDDDILEDPEDLLELLKNEVS